MAISRVPRNLIQPHKFYCNGSLIVLRCHALLVLPLSHEQLLVSVGQDDHNMLNVWKWKDGRILASSRGHTDKVRIVGWYQSVKEVGRHPLLWPPRCWMLSSILTSEAILPLCPAELSISSSGNSVETHSLQRKGYLEQWVSWLIHSGTVSCLLFDWLIHSGTVSCLLFGWLIHSGTVSCLLFDWLIHSGTVSCLLFDWLIHS